MKVMTFNIQHALDYRNRVIDIDLFVRTIAKHGADFCGLNEVRGAGPVEGYTDQTNAIGDGLGWNRHFGQAILVKGTSPYGNAIVTRLPVLSAETVLIPDPAERSEAGHYETRCVVKTIVEADGVNVCFLVCHMGLMLDERRNAVETICSLIDSTDMPVVLMGDFNALPDSPELQPLYDRLLDSTLLDAQPGAPTFPSDAPRTKIDYMLYRGLKCSSVTTINEVVSDHLPIIAEFSPA